MKNMTIEAIKDRIHFIRQMSFIQPKLAEDEMGDLQDDFLRMVISELPRSCLAAKAELILEVEAPIRTT